MVVKADPGERQNVIDDRHHARGQFHVARGIVDAADGKMLEQRDVRGVHPDAVRAHHVRPQQSDAREICNR